MSYSLEAILLNFDKMFALIGWALCRFYNQQSHSAVGNLAVLQSLIVVISP